MSEENEETAVYEGTENSKFGKLVIAKSSGKTTSGQPVMVFVDEGPEDKGFVSVSSAMSEVKTLAEEEWADLTARAEEEMEKDGSATISEAQLSTYYVLRVAKVVSPRAAVRVELDLGA